MSKIAREVAEQEFDRWAQVCEIDITTNDLDDEEMRDFKAFKNKFIKRVEIGSLTVDEEGVIELTPLGGGDEEPLRFEEPNGAILSARQKNDDDVQATRRTLGKWAKVPPKRFADMKLRDFNFCATLLAFFGNS